MLKISTGIRPLRLFCDNVRTRRDLREENWGGMGPTRAGFDLRLICCREELEESLSEETERVVLVRVKQLKKKTDRR